jgi:signal transduction histidine kinase
MTISKNGSIFVTIGAVALFSTLYHGIAIVQFQSTFASLNLPSQYTIQFKTLLALSFACSLVTAILQAIRTDWRILMIPFSLHFLFVILLGLPMGRSLRIETSLLTLLLVETAILFDFPQSAIVAGAMIIIMIAVQCPVNAWYQVRPRPEIGQLVGFGLNSAFLAFSFNLVKKLHKKVNDSTTIINNMSNSILKLTEANVRFQHYASSVEANSTEHERNRITREIHDSTGYALTNIIMMIEEAQEMSANGTSKLKNLLDQTKSEAKNAMSEIRRALRELRNVDDSKAFGLREVFKLAKAFESVTNVSTKVEVGDVPWSFGEMIDLAVYRMVQEGLTNAFKHGKATRINVLIGRDDQGILVRVSDNGQGCSHPKEGIGLAGMRERIEQLHGTLTMRNDNYGFEVLAWIPWDVK